MDKQQLIEQGKELLVKVNNLPSKDQSFALSLATQATHGYLSKNQMYWFNIMLSKAKGQTANLPQQTTAEIGGFENMIALFLEAKKHLKYPKIILQCLDKDVVLSGPAGAGSKFPGSINVTSKGDFYSKTWYGRITQDGKLTISAKVDKAFTEPLVDLLKEFAGDPAGVAQKYGKLTGNCCFCNSELSDPRSTAAGFGPVCADHYGLKEQWKKAVRKAKEAKVKEALPLNEEGLAKLESMSDDELKELLVNLETKEATKEALAKNLEASYENTPIMVDMVHGSKVVTADFSKIEEKVAAAMALELDKQITGDVAGPEPKGFLNLKDLQPGAKVVPLDDGTVAEFFYKAAENAGVIEPEEVLQSNAKPVCYLCGAEAAGSVDGYPICTGCGSQLAEGEKTA